MQFAGPFAPILLGESQLNHSASSTIMYVAATKRLTHQGAKHMAAVAVERAQRAGIAIAVAVADAGGHLVVLNAWTAGGFTPSTRPPPRRSARPRTSVRPRPGARRRSRSMSPTRSGWRSPRARSGGPPWRAASQ